MTLQTKLFVLFSMIFCHIVDDYYLQGILASMKQKDWWKINASASLYSTDYKIALIAHGFSWSFVMSFPVVIYYFFLKNNLPVTYFICLIINSFTHAFIDDLKANKKSINLKNDQGAHLMQTLYTWLFCIIW